MPRQPNFLRVFVASPDDVKQERKQLESVINEINKTIGSSATQLELVKAETDVSPGIGAYPQDVVNKDIGDDYDIFIGIMWKKLGTPTKVAPSGTVEEFERARERNTMYPGSVSIKFYFNKKPIKPDEIDTKQLNLLNEFRNSLGDKGVYWDEYSNMTQFTQKMRMHLNREIKNFEKKKEVIQGTTTANSGSPASCELLYEHDENGNRINGSVQRLIEFINQGCLIRIRVHHPNGAIQVMEAPLLSIENNVVYASDIDQISKTKDKTGNYVYQDKPYHYYIIASSNGHFHAKRIFLDGTDRNTTQSKRHIAWIGLHR